MDQLFGTDVPHRPQGILTNNVLQHPAERKRSILCGNSFSAGQSDEYKPRGIATKIVAPSEPPRRPQGIATGYRCRPCGEFEPRGIFRLSQSKQGQECQSRGIRVFQRGPLPSVCVSLRTDDRDRRMEEEAAKASQAPCFTDKLQGYMFDRVSSRRHLVHSQTNEVLASSESNPRSRRVCHIEDHLHHSLLPKQNASDEPMYSPPKPPNMCVPQCVAVDLPPVSTKILPRTSALIQRR